VNEEEVKAKIVLPWLERQGVRLAELSLESSLSIKAGRHSLNIRPGSTSQMKGARLDILVTRAGVNLLLVEVKAEPLQLDDEDRDQAVSYARLVHPIAPFALVTNGTAFQLFDSITKERIADQSVTVGKYTISLSDAARREALEILLQNSPTNLQQLCRLQVESETAPPYGS
jgi:hypothetical protein